MSNKVGIIEYGAGNIKSLANTFQHINVEVILINKELDFNKVNYLVLPGVGAFGYCMEKLNKSKLIPNIIKWINNEKPLLGICVGMQMLFKSSEEQGHHDGLGLLDGKITDLRVENPEVKVPHVGWNKVTFQNNFNLFKKNETEDFYFAHSYSFENLENNYELAHCTHGKKFCAIIKNKNIIGVQFHPEKSQHAGIKFLKSFLDEKNLC